MRSTRSMPAILGHRRRVDEVDGLLGVAGEDADEDGDPEQARVVLGDPAPERDLDAVERPVARAPWARRPSFSHSGTNGASASIASGRTAAMLTALVTTPPVSAALHLLGGVDPGAVLRLGGRGAEVRELRRRRRARTAGATVNGSSGKTSSATPAELAGLEPALDRVEVDQLAAGAVDDPNARRASSRSPRRRSVPRLRRLRHMKGDRASARA